MFEVSLDRLLGRNVGPRQDLAFTLRTLIDTAEQASGQIRSTQNALRERAAELSSFVFPERDSIVNRCEQAADALSQAAIALGQVSRLPREDGPTKDAKLDMLLERLLDIMPVEETDHEA